MLPLAPIILLIRLATRGTSTGSSSGSGFSATGRAVLWVFGVMSWVGCLLLTLAAIGDWSRERTWERVEIVAVFVSIDVVFGAGLFLAWPILRALARRGTPKLVYYLAHASLIFPLTGETYAGATLLAGIALAHRGRVTKKEVRWLESRLKREQRHLGTFGAAYALIEALKAKRADDKKRRLVALEHAQRARTLFGTLTYFSPRAIPPGVLRFAYEYLALDDARQAHWSAMLLAEKGQATTVVRALASWVREQAGEPAKPYEKRARRRLASPIVERLFSRPKESQPPSGAAEAHALLIRDYDALVRGRAVSPRSSLNVLMLLDTFLHPEYPDTLLPEDIRGDEALVASIHEEVALSLRDVFARTGVPLFALKNIGPVSARVYEALETSLLEEMQSALDRVNEHKKLAYRRDPFAEWLEVAYLRGLYRRIEYTLGPDALARVWKPFAYAYCNLGVLLSETWPRRRPLAFSVFRLLSVEAHRFQDQQQAQQQLHNMTVTSGVQ